MSASLHASLQYRVPSSGSREAGEGLALGILKLFGSRLPVSSDRTPKGCGDTDLLAGLEAACDTTGVGLGEMSREE